MTVQETNPLIREDPYLEPYASALAARAGRFRSTLDWIERDHGGLDRFSSAYRRFGILRDPEVGGWRYREWAPAAEALSLVGDFNDWDRSRHPLHRSDGGVWELFIPDDDPRGSPRHGSRVKVHVITPGRALDRIPAWIRAVYRDPVTETFDGMVWHPESPFAWTDAGCRPLPVRAPLIYEAHPGMAQERPGIGSYLEFADLILPRIAKAGYNCVQLMAVMQHPYYASFGYHVSSFFAPSCWFGTPDELKALVDRAHALGLALIMDVVHSHAVKNVNEGLNDFDGSGNQYFVPGPAGDHPQWDSKLFDYARPEVMQFLLSNLRFWLEEYHFDGFRFDGVTSMLYHHHGVFEAFDHYDRYFHHGVNDSAVLYLQLGNEIVHSTVPGALSVAEDMSGMPGLCRETDDGGLGFDFRLGMGIPDFWIKLLKHVPDESWDMGEIWRVLTDRRYREKTIAYAESHDQALVGDKTVAFWLMDREMYDHMSVDTPSPIIDRGIALHKMIRLVTLSAGGEGYLNFMGNEFGHPEWIDFPREGNGWSYEYARRQWSLFDNEQLRYRHLGRFDRAMIELARDHGIVSSPPAQLLNLDQSNQTLIFERHNRLFLFNFHPDRSIPDYRFRPHRPGRYRIVLNSDRPEFGGFDRIDDSLVYEAAASPQDPNLSIYLTQRTALVLAAE